MKTMRASRARIALYGLLDEAAATHEPIKIEGKRNCAILIGEEDWRAIEETLYLLAIPGMRESIRRGMALPVSKCARTPGW